MPHAYLSRRVRVRSDSRLVRIYLNSELIKVHPRMAPGRRSTDPNDYPPGKADYALRNVDALIERARKHGLYVGQFAERLLDYTRPMTTVRYLERTVIQKDLNENYRSSFDRLTKTLHYE